MHAWNPEGAEVAEDLSADEREAVGAAIVRALDEIGQVVNPRLELERVRLSQPQTITG